MGSGNSSPKPFPGTGSVDTKTERLRLRQLVGEFADRLGVDRGGVPFDEGGEVRLALVPARAALPAVRVQEIGGRGERVGRGADQVAAAAAVRR
jgi:hypothetical protein